MISRLASNIAVGTLILAFVTEALAADPVGIPLGEICTERSVDVARAQLPKPTCGLVTPLPPQADDCAQIIFDTPRNVHNIRKWAWSEPETQQGKLESIDTHQQWPAGQIRFIWLYQNLDRYRTRVFHWKLCYTYD